MVKVQDDVKGRVYETQRSGSVEETGDRRDDLYFLTQKLYDLNSKDNPSVHHYSLFDKIDLRSLVQT